MIPIPQQKLSQQNYFIVDKKSPSNNMIKNIFLKIGGCVYVIYLKHKIELSSVEFNNSNDISINILIYHTLHTVA